MSGIPRALVLGLDGATFDVIRPLVAAGRLPNLARWMRDGIHAPAESTVPAMTFPAWSTFMTGLEPGKHGLFDFTQKRMGAYRIRFTNARDRTGATLFGRVSRAGGNVLCLGMPTTWPPEPVNGLIVAGFDAPVSRGTDPSRTSDPTLYREVAERTGPWMTPDLDESAQAGGWHERTIELLLARIERKTNFALEALRVMAARGRSPQLACVVWSESDTVAHHFWRDHDPDSPRRVEPVSAARAAAVAAVYEKLDAACGELRNAFGAEAPCVLVSDHGSGGASSNVVHLNRYLAECGLLRRRGAGALDGLARTARDTALRVLPPGIAEAVFRRVGPAAAAVESAARFGGIDWSQSAAFSEEVNTQPGVWINAKGRESRGSIADDDYEKLRDEVIAALADWKLPGGAAVVARARRREEVYRGPFVERAPDIVVELGLDAGYGLSLVATPWHDASTGSLTRLAGDGLAGGRGRGMNGVHRPHGFFIGHGPGFDGISADGVRLADLAPTLLDVLGIPWDDELDGLALAPAEYDAADQAKVAARLKNLGYLE